MIVVDASVLTDFLLGRTAAVDAVERELAGIEHEPLHAPELIELETLNALRGLAAGGWVTEERAREAVSDLGDTRLVRYPHAPLRERVWDLRHNRVAAPTPTSSIPPASLDPRIHARADVRT